RCSHETPVAERLTSRKKRFSPLMQPAVHESSCCTIGDGQGGRYRNLAFFPGPPTTGYIDGATRAPPVVIVALSIPATVVGTGGLADKHPNDESKDAAERQRRRYGAGILLHCLRNRLGFCAQLLCCARRTFGCAVDPAGSLLRNFLGPFGQCLVDLVHFPAKFRD